MKKTTLAFLFLASTVVQAQYPRKVLMEYFTNVSCIPCIQANIGVDGISTQFGDQVSTIKYHVWFPNPGDPNYQDNPYEQANRFNFYGFQGIPSVALDGTFNSNGGIPAPALVDLRLQTTSQFQITTTYTIKDLPNSIVDSVYITVVVKAGVNIFNASNLRLRNVIKENKTTVGFGGVLSYSNIFKKVVPDTNGTMLPVSFYAGDSVIISYAIPLIFPVTGAPLLFNLNDFGLTSYIQDESTGEILQVTDGMHIPEFSITPDVTAFKPAKMADASDETMFTIPFHITTSTPATFSIVLRTNWINPAGWTKQITVNGTSNPDSVLISFAANTDTIINVVIQLTSTALLNSKWDGDITITNIADQENYLNFNSTSPLAFYLTSYSKCIQAVLHQSFADAYITDALNQTGNTHLIMERNVSDIDTVNFNSSSIQHLFISYNYDTLQNELPLLTNLLNSGGNLFMENGTLSLDAYYTSDVTVQDFYHHYAGAQFSFQLLTPSTINPVVSDPYYNTVPNSGPYSSYILSAIAPHPSAPDAKRVLTYNNNALTGAAIRNTNGNFKTALLGFTMGQMLPQSITNQVIQSTLNWFNGTATGVEDPENSDSGTPGIFYNGNGQYMIKIDQAAHVIITDVTGRICTETIFEPGLNTISIQQQPAGIYFLNIYFDDNRFSFKLIGVSN